MKQRKRQATWRLRRALKNCRTRVSFRLGLAVCIVALTGLALLSSLVIHADSKTDRTGSGEQQNPTTPINATAKPFGVALGGTLGYLNNDQLNSELDALDALGVRWIRIDVAWPQVQPTSSTQYSWSMTDRVVAAANAHHLKVLGTVAFTPAWAATSGCNDSTQKCAPENDSLFANFAASAAYRYSTDGVDAWEIWNEPNNEGFWTPAPNPEAYTQLLMASYTAIKKVDPSVPVLSGSLGPLDNEPASVEPVSFLSSMYADGARNYFDAVGFHPYSYPDLPSTVATWSGWSMMDDLPISIRSVMIANGDAAKQVWITEYGAPTGGTFSVTDQTQAEMLTQSTTQYENYPWLGNYFWYSYKDLGADSSDPGDYFGLLTYSGNQKPAYSAFEKDTHNSK